MLLADIDTIRMRPIPDLKITILLCLKSMYSLFSVRMAMLKKSGI
jgi:hypothetical protein